ncbi:hypothetical protein mRhiFer1_009028 [Rhinolophus ferrumequinum]|uniref:Uncharacterized protein n=1 Tax=Rhinolophus ferrumequinum TaxID=59479 RepID=A0A7J7SXE6_RHIFE|nr:hypothetical protein mRhiFer1_009028 [Rhinolophus ferrumequinum]
MGGKISYTPSRMPQPCHNTLLSEKACPLPRALSSSKCSTQTFGQTYALSPPLRTEPESMWQRTPMLLSFDIYTQSRRHTPHTQHARHEHMHTYTHRHTAGLRHACACAHVSVCGVCGVCGVCVVCVGCVLLGDW